jgi:hypothetical protein
MYRRLREAKVDDPLEDLLDLARATKVRLGHFRYLSAFGFLGGLMAGSVLVMIFLLRLALGVTESIDFMLVVGAAVSFTASVLGVKTEDFLDHFERRLTAIEGFIRFDPQPAIPSGPDPISRAVQWLRSIDPRFDKVMARNPQRLLKNRTPKGSEDQFSAYILRKSPWLPRMYHAFFQVFDRPVTVHDLERVKQLVDHVLSKTKVPPNHVLLVQTDPIEIPEEVERWIDEHWVLYPMGRKPGKEFHACPLQLVVEGKDGRYDVACVFAG